MYNIADDVDAVSTEFLLDFVASKIGKDTVMLASELGIEQTEVERIQEEYPGNPHEKAFNILYIWVTKNPELDHEVQLRGILKTLQRNDIVMNLSELQKNNYTYDSLIGSMKLKDGDVSKVAQELAGNAYRLGRFLGISQNTIRLIKEDNPVNITTQTCKMLNWWRKNKPANATRQNLCDGLVYVGQRNVADKLTGPQNMQSQ